MKNLVRIGLLTAMLSVSTYAYAENSVAPVKMAGMNCPMAGEMTTMKTDMTTMMKDMEGIMEGMNDPAMKKHMQEMHDKMKIMMGHMDKMHGSMEQMMDKKTDGAVKSDADPAVTPEEHKAHHPEQ
jgi:hypothetical protein